MAAEIQKGTAKLFGITNSGSAFTIDAFATFVPQTASLTHKFRLVEEQDHLDADNTLIATNPYVEGVITIEPSGATRSAAAAVAVFLTPLATVVLANFKLAALNGSWIYTGDQKIDLAFNQSAKIELPIRKYDDSTQNTSLNTTVSG